MSAVAVFPPSRLMNAFVACVNVTPSETTLCELATAVLPNISTVIFNTLIYIVYYPLKIFGLAFFKNVKT